MPNKKVPILFKNKESKKSSILEMLIFWVKFDKLLIGGFQHLTQQYSASKQDFLRQLADRSLRQARLNLVYLPNGGAIALEVGIQDS